MVRDGMWIDRGAAVLDKVLIEYLPILIFLGIAAVIAGAAIGASYLVSTQNPDPAKNSAYECGFEPFGGARNTVHLISAEDAEPWPEMSKEEVARRLADRIAAFLDACAPGETTT